MQRTKIKTLFDLDPSSYGKQVMVMGWVRTFRSNRFIAMNDGSTIRNIQVVIDFERMDKSELNRISTGACLSVVGRLVHSSGTGQAIEIQNETLTVLGDSPAETYPLQPKKHSLEFLREIAYLRARTNTFGAVMRLRHALAFATHQFFHERGFFHIHTPIITGSDAEGAGAMFRVTTLDMDRLPRDPHGKVDFHQDFFAKEANLTVSGQLEAETYALALGEVYTFGPTFRAENSNTTRHLAEFWMIEPEMAFYTLHDTMQLAQDFLQYLMRYVLTHCSEDLAFLDQRMQEEERQKPKHLRSEMGLIDHIQFVTQHDFERMTYTQAIDILQRSTPNKKKKFDYPIYQWGCDLQSEHERFLVEKYCKKPVILYDYPKDIKSFYMRQNDDDRTVAAMDILFPGMGEVVGGSQREERYDVLLARMRELRLSEEELQWYLNLRKFGTAPHSGFGAGFERLMLFVTAMTNIRDVIPYPRFPGNAEF